MSEFTSFLSIPPLGRTSKPGIVCTFHRVGRKIGFLK
jgi:hypothetical protein